MASHPVAQMAAASVACLAAVLVATGAAAPVAVIAGMAAPLAAAIVTWLLVERTHRRAPAGVSGVMIKLFGAKLVLIGAYVAAVVTMLDAGVVPFVVSFVAHYLLLHVMEAVSLRRLLLGGAVPDRSI
jgi:hypothetical protein